MGNIETREEVRQKMGLKYSKKIVRTTYLKKLEKKNDIEQRIGEGKKKTE